MISASSTLLQAAATRQRVASRSCFITRRSTASGWDLGLSLSLSVPSALQVLTHRYASLTSSAHDYRAAGHPGLQLALSGTRFFLPNDQEALKESPPGEQTYFRCWISPLRNEHPHLVFGPASQHSSFSRVGLDGRFAIDLGTRYSTGRARDPFSHLSSVQENKFFAHFGDAIHRLISRHRKRIEENLDEAGCYGFHDLCPGFKTERAKSEPKSRWADAHRNIHFTSVDCANCFPRRYLFILFALLGGAV